MPVLDVLESQKLLKKYKIPVASSVFCRKEGSLKEALKRGRSPVAIKLVSPEITHKTEVEGVKLGISSLEMAKKAFSQLAKIRGFKGVLVQEMASGTEVIIGGKRDPTFGPVLLFGLGGIFVEVMKDFSLRVCPISASDADEMVREIKGYKILSGFRDAKPVKIPAIKDCLLKTSKLMMHEDNVKELDINPLIVNEREIKAVDARVVI